ncbi:MAG: PQQ-binding-like beta-propeller repeat protein [Myxococcota bacterium]|nr:PQQ-binding-like beta-propeller repeat protein [Myxococcota bacterium]
MKARLAAVVVLGACGGGHETEEIASVPIDPVAGEAVFVVNGGDNSISVIDAARDEVAGTIELLGIDYPHHIYASADRTSLLVAVPGSDLSGGHGGGGHASGGGAVLVLDAETGALRAARRLDKPNHNATYSPDGSGIWTSQVASPGQVLILDAATLATRTTTTVGDEPAEVTFSASGTYAFVANTASDNVTILDPETGAVVDTKSVGDAPVGAWPGVDGRMYVDNEAGKSVSVIDPATRAVVATLPLGFTPALAAIAPSGQLWVTDTENGKMVFLDAATGARLGDLVTAAGAHAFAFSRDGTKAYVTNQKAASVTVIDVATRSVTKTIAVGTKPNGIVVR